MFLAFEAVQLRAVRAEVLKYPLESDDAVGLHQRVQAALATAKAAAEQEMKQENKEAAKVLRRCASSKSLTNSVPCDSESDDVANGPLSSILQTN